MQRKVLSLFTGAGGFDLGLERAGFKVCGAVEMDRQCRETIKKNKKWPLSLKRDILSYNPAELRREFKLRRKELAVLSAGPPCQPFSKAGFWVNGSSLRMKDPRARTIKACLDIAEELLPMVLLVENVEGIAYRDKNEGLKYIERRLRQINRGWGTNYVAQTLKVNAAHYGVPQVRERIFIVALRNGGGFYLPPPTHAVNAKDYDSYPNISRASTAWDAIGGLAKRKVPPELKASGRWAELLPSIPEGRNYLWLTEKGGGKAIFGWRTKYWSFLLKLAKDQPSWTIQAQPGPATGPFHWDNRKLSIEELLRLQTFPEGYQITGSFSQAKKQIGNAVPSAIGELFGLEIRRKVFGERVRRALRLIPKHRRQIPNRTPIKRVPRKYLKHAG